MHWPFHHSTKHVCSQADSFFPCTKLILAWLLQQRSASANAAALMAAWLLQEYVLAGYTAVYVPVMQQTLQPREVANVPVFFNATATGAGQFAAALRIASNDPFAPEVTLTVRHTPLRDPTHCCASHSIDSLS